MLFRSVLSQVTEAPHLGKGVLVSEGGHDARNSPVVNTAPGRAKFRLIPGGAPCAIQGSTRAQSRCDIDDEKCEHRAAGLARASRYRPRSGVFCRTTARSPPRDNASAPVDSIIEDPNYPRIYAELDELSAACTAYKTEHRLGKAPNYYHIFTNSGHDDQIARIGEKMEELIEELSNGKDKYLFELLNRYPVLSTNAHKSPFLRKTLNVLAGLVVPIGIVFYFRIWIFGMQSH